MPWWKFLDSAKQGSRRRNITQRKQLAQTLKVHLPRAFGILEQGLDLRCKEKPFSKNDIVEWLDTQMIPCEKKLFALTDNGIILFALQGRMPGHQRIVADQMHT